MSSQAAAQLWDNLWQNYRQRVNYAQVYEQMITEARGTVANDHIAFRSLRLTANGTNLGIPYLARIVEKLGYEVAGEYQFPDQHLYAQHFRHPEQDQLDLPKLFISELLVEELPENIADLIAQTVTTDACFPDVASLELNQLARVFSRPWDAPRHSVIETVNSVSQYGAWVLLHGYAVNHFTGYVNRQNTSRYPDIESTIAGLVERQVPMKAAIEGSYGSGLRQTATQAVKEQVTVRDDATGELIQIPWTYAYYEIAERNSIEVAPGRKQLFEAFLGPQAKNLFEMTRRQ
ncbi:DUF1338 domain-containing protein [Leptolyngbya sp. FACHB-261]|uniref:DUF1338 domain-containing protein n=1 Tax=Leptolyngbya sp. FACHB-261 TaxID=2692806 RepID=UPI001689354F|nr:DUF1338 domain-containing protein [Leptolyngbya sp. FACHB-261]MBD2100549.1 DUF1338 domain-containing protein [Leptolyngbya sp. FACHB-261]